MSRHKNLQRYIDEEEDDYDDYDYDDDYDEEYDEGEGGDGLEKVSFDIKEISIKDTASPASKQNSQKPATPGNKNQISKFGEAFCSPKSKAATNDRSISGTPSSSSKQQQFSLYEDVSSLKTTSFQESGDAIMKRTGSKGSFKDLAMKRTDSKGSFKELAMKRTDSRASTTSSDGGRKRKPFDYSLLSQAKDHLNLIIVGHVDAGKSTLVGHLLVLAKEVDQKVIQKYERESQKIGKGSFAYAWVMDENEDERSRGITIEVGVTRLNFPNRVFTLLDSPGHRDFIPNMLSGASQADVAILVVDAAIGAFESGFESNGQTKEHAMLLRSLGINQVIVAINKLDAVGWSKDRYDEISFKVGAFLSQIGLKKESVFYVPCSGLTGENLLTAASNPDQLVKWYGNGPTMADLMNRLQVPVRPYDKPLRINVSDYFKGTGSNAVAVCGRLEGGVLQTQDRVLLQPIGEILTIKSISKNNENAEWASAGDLVILNCTGIDIAQMNISYVICSIDSPISVSDVLTVQLVTFDIKIPLICGSSVVFYHGSCSEEAVVTKLIGILDKTGKILDSKKAPRCIPRNCNAQVQITLKRKICVERFADSKEFSRFTLRLEGESIGAGIITEIH